MVTKLDSLLSGEERETFAFHYDGMEIFGVIVHVCGVLELHFEMMRACISKFAKTSFSTGRKVFIGWKRHQAWTIRKLVGSWKHSILNYGATFGYPLSSFLGPLHARFDPPLPLPSLCIITHSSSATFASFITCNYSTRGSRVIERCEQNWVFNWGAIKFIMTPHFCL